MRQKQTRCGAFAADSPACSELRHRETSTNRPKKCSFQQPASAELFEFAAVDGRRVVAGFDRGAITSDAGALLLGATDRAIRLIERPRLRVSTLFGGVQQRWLIASKCTRCADTARGSRRVGRSGARLDQVRILSGTRISSTRVLLFVTDPCIFVDSRAIIFEPVCAGLRLAAACPSASCAA